MGARDKPSTLWIPGTPLTILFKNRKDMIPTSYPPPPLWSSMDSWLQGQLRSMLSNSSWFSWDIPSFSTENLTSWETLLSQANLDG